MKKIISINIDDIPSDYRIEGVIIRQTGRKSFFPPPHTLIIDCEEIDLDLDELLRKQRELCYEAIKGKHDSDNVNKIYKIMTMNAQKLEMP